MNSTKNKCLNKEFGINDENALEFNNRKICKYEQPHIIDHTIKFYYFYYNKFGILRPYRTHKYNDSNAVIGSFWRISICTQNLLNWRKSLLILTHQTIEHFLFMGTNSFLTQMRCRRIIFHTSLGR